MDPPREGSRWTWPLLGLAFCAFWVVYLTLFGPRPRAPKLEGSSQGEMASYSWTLLDLDDKPVPFARYEGRPVFLNIWATWCPPCVREMPSIARLAVEPRLKDKGIAFVCASTDDSSVEVRRFLEGRPWHMSFFRTEKLPPVFSTEGIPATFIIAADGRIVSAEVGAADWDTPEVVALLEKLANEAPVTPPQPR